MRRGPQVSHSARVARERPGNHSQVRRGRRAAGTDRPNPLSEDHLISWAGGATRTAEAVRIPALGLRTLPDNGRTVVVGQNPGNERDAGRYRTRRLPVIPRNRERRRRPSGEPAPLPRKTLAGSGKVWLPMAAAAALILVLVASPTQFFLGTGEWWDRLDQQLTDAVTGLRNGVLTGVAKTADALRNEWLLRGLRWGTVIGLIFFKRWRHLAVFIGSILVTQLAVMMIANRLARPRPDGIEFLTDWSGFSQPSLAVVAITLTLVGMTYALVVPGRPRRRVLVTAGVVIAVVGLARVYLGVDRFSDILTASLIGTAAPLLAYRFWTPDAVFPVSYRRAKTAHLEMNETRKQAIVGALGDQLGLAAVDLELFGAEGSGGSTPLRVGLAGDEPQHVFAKLYAQNHLRSDRWYKLGRSLLYGALEDETAFRTVRELAEREDYLMRLMVEAGVPGPRPLGIVEITPGREYLLVAEFLPGTREASEAVIDGEVVDNGLRAIRALWDNGLAHRDIKPANVLVRDGEVFLIDVAFGETRPSPWRQAVDLANMLLTLSLRHPAEQVHRTALTMFTEDDIAEACAATRSITMPGELRGFLKTADRDVLAVHRSLVPDRKPIRIQRWTRRRLAALGGAAVVLALTGWLTVLNLSWVRHLL